MILRALFSVLLIVLFQFPVLSSNSGSNDKDVEEIFRLIYNQQFDEAEKLLSKKRVDLDAFYADVLQIDLHWWKYSTSRSLSDAKKLKSILKTNTPNSISSEEKTRELIKKSYLMRYERKRLNLIRAAIVKTEINELLTNLDPEELQLSGQRLKLFELYILMFQYFETINPFTLFDLPDKRLKPLYAMEAYSAGDDFIVCTMAHYFLGRIYHKIERQPAHARLHFEVLTNEFPGNNLFKKYFEDCSK